VVTPGGNVGFHIEGIFRRSFDPFTVNDKFGEDLVVVGESSSDFVVT
jgi:uncharacterized protein YxjI